MKRSDNTGDKRYWSIKTVERDPICLAQGCMDLRLLYSISKDERSQSVVVAWFLQTPITTIKR